MIIIPSNQQKYYQYPVALLDPLFSLYVVWTCIYYSPLKSNLLQRKDEKCGLTN